MFGAGPLTQSRNKRRRQANAMMQLANLHIKVPGANLEACTSTRIIPGFLITCNDNNTNTTSNDTTTTFTNNNDNSNASCRLDVALSIPRHAQALALQLSVVARPLHGSTQSPVFLSSPCPRSLGFRGLGFRV